MRRFYCFKRGQIYYAQVLNPVTKKLCTARSTGQTTLEDAQLVVADWLSNGIPEARGAGRRSARSFFDMDAIVKSLQAHPALTLSDASKIIEVLKDKGLVESVRLRDDKNAELVIAFLERFWDNDTSPYVKEKRAHGQSIGKRHINDSFKRIRLHWKPYFEGVRLQDLQRKDIKAFSLALAEKNLKPASVNRILVAGTTALHWAYLNELIPTDPSEGIMKFSGKSEKRGVLTLDEAYKLFSTTWKDERARIGNYVAMTTGLRSGEVLALRRGDIGDDRLFIRHSWSDVDGLKCPKNGEERTVPLLPELREDLLRLVKNNPNSLDDDAFIFYSTLSRRPMDTQVLLSGLKNTLVRMSVDKDATEEMKDKATAAWTSRNVVFHSWRHFYAARMADNLEARVVMQATGHKTGAVFQAYAAHATEEDFKRVGTATKKIFGFKDEQAKLTILNNQRKEAAV